MRHALQGTVAISMLTAIFSAPAMADVVLSGPTSTAGTYSTVLLSTVATIDDTVSSGGLTGITAWGLLGGANASSSTSPVYGDITTSTPVGDNGKNAILRYYLLATNSSGQESVVSLGEIDPNFGGTVTNPSSPAFIAYQSMGGLLAAPELVVPGAAGRDLTNLTSLQLLAVPALPAIPIAPGGESTSIQLSGNVTRSGTYDLNALQSDFTEVTENVQGATYSGVPLWTFLDPSDANSLNQIVTVQATDGLEVVLSLAELDPAFVGNPLNILPYAGPNFPGVGVARTIFVDDTVAHGRWVSNVDAIIVSDVPEPTSLTLLAVSLAAVSFVRRGLQRPIGATPMVER